jgi:hypothetical protein
MVPTPPVARPTSISAPTAAMVALAILGGVSAWAPGQPRCEGLDAVKGREHTRR